MVLVLEEESNVKNAYLEANPTLDTSDLSVTVEILSRWVLFTEVVMRI